MRQFEVGDIISYNLFYYGSKITRMGMISSERKRGPSSDIPLSHLVYYGYDILTEENEIKFKYEEDIEGKVE